ncbi:MAG: Bifunctional hemolysin/adenylate cyclase precursor, partial [Pseudomonadota bacterium]
MSLANSTADVAMINLVMTGVDGTGVWQDPIQLLPMGMNGDPVDYVARIKASLPLVNNLRVLFNEHSFNEDGSLHPQMEAFLAEAVAQGYDLTICYGEGDAQNIGRGIDGWPTLSNAEAFVALQDNFADVSGAWGQMLDWMAAHAEVAQGVWGYELMNESAAYRNTVRANGAGDGLTATDFIKLYTDHTVALADMIYARAAGRILVGGWGYNGDFASLDQVVAGDSTALDLIRAGVGADLVWSAHLYPGWMGTNQATSPADLIARLTAVYAPVAQDALLITEINADGQVDNAAEALDYADFYTASY